MVLGLDGTGVSDLIHSCRLLQRHTHMHGALSLFAVANSQIGVTVQPVHPFVIQAWNLWPQHIVNPSTA